HLCVLYSFPTRRSSDLIRVAGISARKLSMARWRCCLAGWLALIALGSGCVTNRMANPFGSTSSKLSASLLAKKSAKSSPATDERSEEHTSELQSLAYLV